MRGVRTLVANLVMGAVFLGAGALGGALVGVVVQSIVAAYGVTLCWFDPSRPAIDWQSFFEHGAELVGFSTLAGLVLGALPLAVAWVSVLRESRSAGG